MFREQSYFSNIGANSIYTNQSQPMIMQQEYHNNYIFNNGYPQQPVFIAGPIYKNSPIFIGPKYLSQSLFQPVQKPKMRMQEEQQVFRAKKESMLNENLKERDELLKQWSFQNNQEVIKKQNSRISEKSEKSSVKSVKSVKPRQSVMIKTNRKQQAKRNLRVHSSALFFVIWYFSHLKKLLVVKRQRQVLKDNSSDLINRAFQLGTEWSLSFLEPILLDYWNKNDCMDWLENNKLSDKEQRNRINKLIIFVEKIIDKLLENVRDSEIDEELIQFLSQITQNYEFPPDKYYFSFELNRLQFTSFAALKMMGQEKQKMILAIFIIIRIIGFTLLYAPWNLGINSVNRNGIMQNNAKIITSIFHELAVSEFRQMTEYNQNHLSLELKVQGRQIGPMKIIPEPKDVNERTALKNMQEPMIYPLYNVKEMKLLFENNKQVFYIILYQQQFVENIKDKLDEIYSRMMKLVAGWHAQTKIRLSIRTKRLYR